MDYKLELVLIPVSDVDRWVATSRSACRLIG